jgi:hypothetical protein
VGDIHELRKSIGLGDLIIDMAFNRPGRIKNATLAYSELSSSLFIILRTVCIGLNVEEGNALDENNVFLIVSSAANIVYTVLIYFYLMSDRID